MFVHISNGIWAFPLNVGCTLRVLLELEDACCVSFPCFGTIFYQVIMFTIKTLYVGF